MAKEAGYIKTTCSINSVRNLYFLTWRLDRACNFWFHTATDFSVFVHPYTIALHQTKLLPADIRDVVLFVMTGTGRHLRPGERLCVPPLVICRLIRSRLEQAAFSIVVSHVLCHSW